MRGSARLILLCAATAALTVVPSAGREPVIRQARRDERM